MEFFELSEIVESLQIIEDPRRDLGKKHNLVDILIISLLSTICGGEDWTDMEDFGESQFDFLQSFLELPNGVPSHDTFRRVFSILKPTELEKCLVVLWLSERNRSKNQGKSSRLRIGFKSKPSNSAFPGDK